MKVRRPKIVDLLEKLKVVLNGVPPPSLRNFFKNRGRTFEFEEETANGQAATISETRAEESSSSRS